MIFTHDGIIYHLIWAMKLEPVNIIGACTPSRVGIDKKLQVPLKPVDAVCIEIIGKSAIENQV